MSELKGDQELIKSVDVFYKSISRFYFLKIYLQHHFQVEVTANREMRPAPIRVIFNTFLTMKADESADCAVRCCRLRSLVRCQATHRIAQSALSSALMAKNFLKKTRIWAGVSFNGPELGGAF
jgi:hypothetical protein